MGNFPIQYDNYTRNQFYYQYKIEQSFDDLPNNAMPFPQPITGGIKMSIGFCRENLDLNKNAIIENKGKDYWALDLFDGETYSSSFPQYIKYIDDSNLVSRGDVIGAKVDLESGQIEFFKNGVSLGIAFDEGASTFRKGKLFPFIQLYKCKVSVY